MESYINTGGGYNRRWDPHAEEYQEDEGTVEEGSDPRTIPCTKGEGHGESFHRGSR